MGIFNDKEARKLIQNLENENKKLLGRIEKLEIKNIEIQKEISQSATAQNSKKVAEYRNKTEERLDEATNFVTKIEEKLKDIETIYDNVFEINSQITILKVAAENSNSQYRETFEELKRKVENLSQFMEEYPELDEKLSEIDKFISDVEENLTKSNTSLNALNDKKKQIDGFYQNIFGYNSTDENGEDTFVEGKKAVLENLYQELKKDITDTKKEIDNINEDYKSQYDTFETEHKDKYQKLTDDIAKLLPNALTAGLSYGFSAKKEEEVKLLKSSKITFYIGLGILIFFGLIPFFVSIYQLYNGHQLEETILKMPRLVLAIIPIYVPALWLTHSSSKKINLSKRLIEEYSHKEVLSKTYEGLSKQIANIDDEEQSEELRFRLLSILLQVVSENPGKLISNYETSDHPVMEALEQSYKFQLAIDKLETIPGMGKMVAILERKSKKKLAEKEKMIDTALENVEIE